MDADKRKEELSELIRNQFSSLYDVNCNFEVGLLKYSENIIYKITFCAKDVKPVVFRVHRPGYHDIEELESELVWMKEIYEAGILVPRVFGGRDGRVLQKLVDNDGGILYCSVISFLEGTLLEDLSGQELLDTFEELGSITARLHLQSIGRDSGVKLKRFSWDIHNFFDEDGVWGSWRDYKGLTDEQCALFECTQERITDVLEKYGRTREHFGIIHSDLHFCNIMRRDDGALQIFDFDDCGYGFYLYDLGCSLVTCTENLAILTDAWKKGYEKYRPLTDEERGMLGMFVLLRRIVRLAWLASHADNDTVKTVGSDYLLKTQKMAEKWLSGGDAL